MTATTPTWRAAATLSAVLLILALIQLPAQRAAGQETAAFDPLAYGIQGEGEGFLQSEDFRIGSVRPTRAQRQAVARLGVDARWNAMGAPQVLFRPGVTMSPPSDAPAADVARAFISGNAGLFRLSSAGVAGLELLTDGPLYESPDRGRVRDGLPPLEPDVAHVLLFRQTFEGLHAGEDGLLKVGVDREGRVVWASATTTGETAVRGAERLTPTAAWKAAAQAIDFVHADAALTALGAAADARGFLRFALDGVADEQLVRRVAVPTAEDGVRRAYEVTLVQRSPDAVSPATAYIQLVDAETGEVLVRHVALHHLGEGGDAADAAQLALPVGAAAPAAQVGPPTTGQFSGVTGGGAACGPDHPFDVGEGNSQISAFATVTEPADPSGMVGAPADGDIIINIVFEGEVVASGDLVGFPETVTYTPDGGVEPGTYAVQVCGFSSTSDAVAYAGGYAFSALPVDGGAAGAGDPRWRTFPANPLFQLPGDEPNTEDNRATWCWFAGDDCDKVLGSNGFDFLNTASKAPWDVETRSGRPTFTTDGNNAATAASFVSPLTPDVAVAKPFAIDRQYDFPFTNQWFTNSCDPANFVSPARNDIDAATTNLYVNHNRIHDWGYYLGWTEENSTLQRTNYGSTAAARENDPEVGQSQSGALAGAISGLGRDNANQIALQDGVPGISNQYLWQPLQAAFYPPCVDGAYDAGIVGHEVGHAIQVRMTGGPDGSISGTQGGNMRESWSDLTAAEYLNGNEFVPVEDENPFVVGTYAIGDQERGIRNYSMANSPLTYGDLEYDGNGTTSPHADSEIWSAVNFQIREAFNAKYDATFSSSDQALQIACAEGQKTSTQCPGNRRWIQLQHDSFLLQPVAPSMLDTRDAMLAGDILRYGGANQEILWEAFAGRGFGKAALDDVPATAAEARPGTAFSADADDVDAVPGYASPVSDDEAEVAFQAVSVDGSGLLPESMSVFVGRFEARTTPLVSSIRGGTPSDPQPFVPGTYEFVAQAQGFGHVRFSATLAADEERTIEIPVRRNHASIFNGATTSGDGGNLDALVDDTEETNWASLLDGAVQGKQVTVALDGRRLISDIEVSAALRPAGPGEPAQDESPQDDDPPDGDPQDDESETPEDEEPTEPYDMGGQNRFSALRSFEFLTCDATTGADCSTPESFKVVYTSPADAFPAVRPRPRVPDLIVRGFDVPDTEATHVMLRVVENQCTGGPEFQGETNPDSDPANEPDCDEGFLLAGASGGSIENGQGENVRAAELQVFSPTVAAPEPPAPGPGPGDGGDGGLGVLTVERLAGPGRVETAIEASKEAFESADTAILARADEWPDALAASALAAEVEGPILLTPTNELSPLTAAELRRLGVEKVYLAGGTAALDESVEASAGEIATTRRVAGADRIETAAEIGREVVDVGGPVTSAIVARADTYVDALAAGNVATYARAPLFLTPPDAYADATAEVLDDLLGGTGTVVVAGGRAAVSDEVASALTDDGYTVDRAAGAERYATAAELVERALTAGASIAPPILASGVNFPDALTAVPVAHQLGGVTLLVDPLALSSSQPTADLLAANAAAFETVYIAGGTAAISQDVEDEVRALITSSRATAR